MAATLSIYEKLIELKSNGVEVVELQHAFRLNGVIDIWKFTPTVFEIPNNKYTTFRNKIEAFGHAMKMYPVLGKRSAFRATEKGRKTYQEFRQSNSVDVFESEYMHWKASANKTSEDHLYFIANEIGEVKIGRSKNPKQRMSSIKTGSATNVVMLHIAPNKGCMEKQIHRCLEDIGLNGEWFAHTDRIDRFIEFIKSHKFE